MLEVRPLGRTNRIALKGLQALKLQWLKPLNARTLTSGLKSLCENSKFARFCSARLQAGTLESSTCPPEGGRYKNQNRVLTQTLKPRPAEKQIQREKFQVEIAPSARPVPRPPAIVLALLSGCFPVAPVAQVARARP